MSSYRRLRQPVLLEFEQPLKMCGDTMIYFDFLSKMVFHQKATICFLGLCGWGNQSLETASYWLTKLNILRIFLFSEKTTNSASMNRIYGFYDECKRRYNIKLWKTFTDCFNCLLTVAIMIKKIFCCHGGLSPDLQSMEQICELYDQLMYNIKVFSVIFCGLTLIKIP